LVSPSGLTTDALIERIIAHRNDFVARNAAKEAREVAALKATTSPAHK